MKGSPIRDALILLTLFLGLLVPLLGLSRKPIEPQGEPQNTETVENIEAWLDIRLSHPASSIRVLKGDQEINEVEEAMGVSLDTELSLEGETFSLEIQWPEMVGRPYVEVRLEPEGLPAIVRGKWGKPGVQTFRWFFQPEEMP